jgi:hypothetical protein
MGSLDPGTYMSRVPTHDETFSSRVAESAYSPNSVAANPKNLSASA